MVPNRAYLIRVHLELANNFDADLLTGLGVFGAVDVAEGTVAHLLDQDETLQARIAGHLVGLFSLFGHERLDVGVSGATLDFLIFPLCLSSSMASLGSDIAIVAGGDGKLSRVVYASLVVLLFLVGQLGLAYAMMILLLLDVDRRNVGGGLVAGRVRLLRLAMADQILDILNGTHD